MASQLGAIDQAGAKIIFKQIFEDRRIENTNEIFKTNANYDANRVARSENEAIIWQNIFDMPKPEENHQAHLKMHEDYLTSVVLLPEGSQADPVAIQRMKMHIQMHKQFQQSPQAQGGAQTGQQGTIGPATVESPGQAIGGAIAGDMGTMGNLPATGRPPEITGGGEGGM